MKIKLIVLAAGFMTMLSQDGFSAPAKIQETVINGVAGFKDTPVIPNTPWHVHDPERPQPPVVKPGDAPSKPVPAPSDAIVLFDGSDLSKWRNKDGQPAAW